MSAPERIRALVIAIEDYPGVGGLARKLEGTNAAAEAFIWWLRDKKGVPAANIHYCAATDRPGRGAGTARMELVREAKALVTEGRDQTDELYVFFSGHGFSFQEGPAKKPADILVASDFTTPEESGGACIRLRELQEKLQMALGPGDHYYFIDACRNLISEDDIEPTKLGVKFEPSMLGIGTLFTLYSTAAQSLASVRSGFAQHLVEGLRGQGRAKGWVNERLYVTFDLLQRYVRSRMPQQDADRRIEGSSDGQIIELQPIPVSRCRLRVVNASSGDAFKARIGVEQGGQRLTLREAAFQGPETLLELRPGDYVFDVQLPGARVTQRSPAGDSPVDAYESCEVEFEKQPLEQPVPGPSAPALASMNIRGPADAQLEVTRAEDVSRHFIVPKFRGALHQKVRPGSYDVRLTRAGKVLSRRHVDVQEGVALELELGNADRVPRALRELGLPSSMPTEEQTSSLMLSLLGAGWLVAPEELPERVRALPHQDFSGMSPGESLVYVLAFFEKGVSGLQVAVGGTPDWRPMRPVAGVDGLWEASVPAPAGPSLFSVRLMPTEGGVQEPSHTYVTHLLPNRATLVTLTRGEERRLELHQYILPIHSLRHELDFRVLTALRHGATPFMQALWEVQYEFARKRTLETSLERDNQDYWMGALYGKWLDPNMALFGAYELLRRRRPGEDLGLLHQAIANLRHYFDGIPDIELLAKLAGLPHQEPRHPPLILDGLLAWDFDEAALPLPAEKLTYEGPWVAWRNAPLDDPARVR